MPDSQSDLINLRNFGPVSVHWLCGAGISTVAELHKGYRLGKVTDAEKATLRREAGVD